MPWDVPRHRKTLLLSALNKPGAARRPHVMYRRVVIYFHLGRPDGESLSVTKSLQWVCLVSDSNGEMRETDVGLGSPRFADFYSEESSLPPD